MRTLAIVYICTGRYEIFWDEFFASAEKHFCGTIKKHYFVFTDSPRLEAVKHEDVTVIHQDNLGWPMIASYRYRILLRIEEQLRQHDLIAFFNANALFVADISPDSFFGEAPSIIVGAEHPLFPKTSIENAPFEPRTASTAYVSPELRTVYFQSAISGGTRDVYLAMLHQLAQNTEQDLDSGIVALWHDESHWNAYLNRRESADWNLNVLPISFVYPERYAFASEKKILMRNKHGYGGHSFLRGQSGKTLKEKILNKVSQLAKFVRK